MDVLQQIASLDSLTGVQVASELRSLRLQIEQQVEQVADVVLFGSRARGDAHQDSDYDIAVVITTEEDQRSVSRAVTALALPFIMAGYHFRPIVISKDFFDSENSNPLARDIARDGISIY